MIETVTALSVNVNKIAWLRNGRGGSEPDPAWAARVCIDSGAAGITVHPRPDQRHIKTRDVYQIAELVAGCPGIEYNIEGNPFEPALADYPGLLKLARDVRPVQVTLVPDSVDQITSNHGWSIALRRERLADAIDQFRHIGCRVSLFMDPDPEEYALARELGADRVELYTEDYARAHAAGDFAPTRERYARAARAAQDLGLGVNAGHDLSLTNLSDFLAIADILEVSIGHALISDALRFGLGASVQKYLACVGH